MGNRHRIYQQIFQCIAAIPEGRVQTYGGIAAQVPEATARMVGYALGHLPSPPDLPWHRVVNAQGRISSRGDGYSDELQRVLLEQEGVEGVNGKIPLSRFQHIPKEQGDR